MKKYVLMVFVVITMLSSAVCFAEETPHELGIILNNDKVIAVNVNSPAYNAGIRPGDKINKVIGDMDNDSREDITIFYNDTKQATITKEKLLDPVQKGTFVVQGDPDELYKRLIKTLMFNNDISPFFPIQSTDKELRLAHSFVELNKKNRNDLPDYYIAHRSTGLGMLSTKITGDFAITEEKPGYSLIKVGLQFSVQGHSIWGTLPYQTLESSGVLEKKVIAAMVES